MKKHQVKKKYIYIFKLLFNKAFWQRKMYVIELWNSKLNSGIYKFIYISFIYFLLLAWRWPPVVDAFSQFKDINSYHLYSAQFISRAIWHREFNFADCDMQLSRPFMKIILRYNTVRMEAACGFKSIRSHNLTFHNTVIYNDKSSKICYTVP